MKESERVERDEATAPERQSLRALIDHIVDTHHVVTRSAVSRIEAALPAVLAAQASEHPEVTAIARAAKALCDDLGPHLMREERVLFPWIQAAEAASARGAPPPPAHFGTVQNPVRVMDGDHRLVLELLRSLQGLTANYERPAWACAQTTALFDALRELDRDLHQHIHLESDVLFPRAIALEAAR